VGQQPIWGKKEKEGLHQPVATVFDSVHIIIVNRPAVESLVQVPNTLSRGVDRLAEFDEVWAQLLMLQNESKAFLSCLRTFVR
jgi:hypothetical protein